jgi:hypothetical protein
LPVFRFQAWDNFIQSSEEVQLMITSNKGFVERCRKEMAYLPSNVPMTGEQAFRNIKTGLRNVLKKNRVPLVRYVHDRYSPTYSAIYLVSVKNCEDIDNCRKWNMFQFQPSAAKNIESLCYSGKKL